MWHPLGFSNYYCRRRQGSGCEQQPASASAVAMHGRGAGDAAPPPHPTPCAHTHARPPPPALPDLPAMCFQGRQDICCQLWPVLYEQDREGGRQGEPSIKGAAGCPGRHVSATALVQYIRPWPGGMRQAERRSRQAQRWWGCSKDSLLHDAAVRLSTSFGLPICPCGGCCCLCFQGSSPPCISLSHIGLLPMGVTGQDRCATPHHTRLVHLCGAP